MRATILLCDFAQVAEGKLNVIGAGWDVKGPGSPMGVGVLLFVSWNETNSRHAWRLSLVDGDGQPVTIPTPVGPQGIEATGTFEMGRPPGVPHGAEMPLALAVNVGPLPLADQQRFTWRLEIDGESEDDWIATFRTAAAPFGRPPIA